MLRLVVQLTNEDCEFLKCKYFQHQDRFILFPYILIIFLRSSSFEEIKMKVAILTFIIIHDIKSIQFVPIYITFAHFHQSLGGDVTYEIRSMIIF